MTNTSFKKFLAPIAQIYEVNWVSHQTKEHICKPWRYPAHLYKSATEKQSKTVESPYNYRIFVGLSRVGFPPKFESDSG